MTRNLHPAPLPDWLVWSTVGIVAVLALVSLAVMFHVLRSVK